MLENGNMLISEIGNGGKAVELTPSGKRVWEINYPFINPKTKRPDLYQQVKRYDLTDFLKNHRGVSWF